MLFTIPSLSPALVTTISGISMVTIIWLLSPESPSKHQSGCNLCGCRHYHHRHRPARIGQDFAYDSSTTQQAAQFHGHLCSHCGCSRVFRCQNCPSDQNCTDCRKGITAATNTALVYTIMNGGQAVLIPVLFCSALFDLYVLRKSLQSTQYQFTCQLNFVSTNSLCGSQPRPSPL